MGEGEVVVVCLTINPASSQKQPSHFTAIERGSKHTSTTSISSIFHVYSQSLTTLIYISISWEKKGVATTPPGMWKHSGFKCK